MHNLYEQQLAKLPKRLGVYGEPNLILWILRQRAVVHHSKFFRDAMLDRSRAAAGLASASS